MFYVELRLTKFGTSGRKNYLCFEYRTSFIFSTFILTFRCDSQVLVKAKLTNQLI